MSAKEVVAAYWAAAEARDGDAFGAPVADDLVTCITDVWPEPYEPPANRANRANLTERS